MENPVLIHQVVQQVLLHRVLMRFQVLEAMAVKVQQEQVLSFLSRVVTEKRCALSVIEPKEEHNDE